MVDDADEIIQADPAQPCITGAERSAEAGPEGGEHRAQSSSARCQDDADAKLDDADTGVGRR